MKFILLFLIGYSSLLHITDSKKYRCIMSDQFLDYDLDNVPSYSTYFDIDHLILEHVDDDTVIGGGYGVCLKSMDRNLPIRSTVRTQYYQNSKWNEGPAQLFQMDVCKDFTNPSRFWNSITKLWTSDVCPPQKGDIWRVENQTLSFTMMLPIFSFEQWRTYIKLYQGQPGKEKHLFGFGIQSEFIEI